MHLSFPNIQIMHPTFQIPKSRIYLPKHPICLLLPSAYPPSAHLNRWPSWLRKWLGSHDFVAKWPWIAGREIATKKPQKWQTSWLRNCSQMATKSQFRAQPAAWQRFHGHLGCLFKRLPIGQIEDWGWEYFGKQVRELRI